MTLYEISCIIVYVRLVQQLGIKRIRPLGQVVKTPPFHGGNMGSSPVGVTIIYYGRIAQLGEHLPYKQGVTGSSPVVHTIIFLA